MTVTSSHGAIEPAEAGPIVTDGVDRGEGLSLAGVVCAGMFGTAFLSITTVPSWHLRAVTLLVAIALGAPGLVKSAWARKLPGARLATGFVAVAVVSAAVSANPTLSLVGRYGRAAGVIFVMGLAAAWAVGASLSPRHRRLLPGVLVGAAAATGAVATWQGLTSPNVDGLELVAGRAAGLLGNPVHAAALLVAVIALVIAGPDRPWRAVATGTLAFAVQATGSRLAVVLLIVVAVAVIARRRSSFAVAAAGAIAVGSLLGLIAFSWSGTIALERVGTAGTAISTRTEAGAVAMRALADRPLLGSGPGLYLDATAPRTTEELARALPEGALFADGHNLILEYGVTTGVIGLLLLVGWLVVAFRTATGPLAVFAAVLLAFHLFEPQSMATTPLMFLTLGAASSRRLLPSAGIAPRGTTAVLLAAAMIVGALLLYGDLRLRNATLDFTTDDSRAAAAVLAPWPNPAAISGRTLLLEAVTGGGDEAGDEALRWFERATVRDPGSPSWWNQLGRSQLALGLVDDAERSMLQALDAYPFSVSALHGLVDVAVIQADEASAVAWAVRANRVSADQIDLDVLRRSIR